MDLETLCAKLGRGETVKASYTLEEQIEERKVQFEATRALAQRLGRAHFSLPIIRTKKSDQIWLEWISKQYDVYIIGRIEGIFSSEDMLEKYSTVERIAEVIPTHTIIHCHFFPKGITGAEVQQCTGLNVHIIYTIS